MKGPALFQGEINTKKGKYIYKLKKFSPEPVSQFQQYLAQSILGWSFFFQMKSLPFQKGDKYQIANIQKSNFNQTLQKASLCEEN